MFTWSATCRTLSIPVRRVFDLFPWSYHDSMPGRMAWKPFFCRRLRCGSPSSERLLSAMCRIRPGGPDASIASM